MTRVALPEVRLIVIAGVRLYREGLAGMLAADQQLAVVGAFATAREALARLGTLPPHIALLDLAGIDVTEVIPVLARAVPGLKVVALGVADTEHDVLACAEAGAAAYAVRESSVDELIATIINTARGELHCSPRMAAALMGRVARLASNTDHRLSPPALLPLTSREQQILALIDGGSSNKEIAAKLHIEIATVKNHVHRILEKLGARSRSEAAAKVRHHSDRSDPDLAILKG